MRQISFIVVFVFLAFFVEYFVFLNIAPWLRPNLILLVTMFFTLSLGIRYGLLTAVLGGLLRDSFGLGFLGVNIFTLMFCAYATTLLRKHIYIISVQWFRVILVMSVGVLHVLINFFLLLMLKHVEQGEPLGLIYFSEIATTILVTSITFDLLRKCVSKFFVL